MRQRFIICSILFYQGEILRALITKTVSPYYYVLKMEVAQFCF